MSAVIPQPSEIDFAALCASRAQLVADGSLLVCDVVDELQAVAEHSGLIDDIGQDQVQDIMGEAFAAATLVPDLNPDLAGALEVEILLRGAELVREWELADPRDRWKHTGEPKPIVRPDQPRRHAAYSPAASTVEAFWHVQRLGNADHLARWLANHPDDAPALYEIWKASQC